MQGSNASTLLVASAPNRQEPTEKTLEAWTMARGPWIGATARCSVEHGSRRMEIAKCLIYNDSLFPVIDITGNSGSLLGVLDDGWGVPVANPQSPPLKAARL